MKVIFLDVDGVLNGWNWKLELLHNILKPIHPLHEKYRLWYIKHGDIHVSKVKRLAKICEQNHAVCVMTSTWRHAYFDKDCDVPDVVRLRKLFKKYNITCKECTENLGDRSNEIRKWLDDHPNIWDYIILDDDRIKDFEGYQVYTRDIKDGRLIYDGLQNKHVKEAKIRFDWMQACHTVSYCNAFRIPIPKKIIRKFKGVLS